MRAGILDRSDFYVYVHSRLHTGEPFYIGKGCGRRSAKASSRNPHWRNIVAKDGGYSTSFIAQGIDEELALRLEIENIDVLRRRGVKLVNMTDGGEGLCGYRPTPETRAKLSAANKGNKRGLGYRHTEDAKNRISAATSGRPSNTKGKKFTDAQLVNVRRHRATLRGVPRSAETIKKMTGRIHSAETRLKMSLASIGRPKSEEHKANLRGRVWTKEQRQAAADRARGNTYRKDSGRKKCALVD